MSLERSSPRAIGASSASARFSRASAASQISEPSWLYALAFFHTSRTSAAKSTVVPYLLMRNFSCAGPPNRERRARRGTRALRCRARRASGFRRAECVAGPERAARRARPLP